MDDDSGGSYMGRSTLSIVHESKRLCQALLDGAQDVPKGSLFASDIFESACAYVEDKNEVKVIRDISRLMVPSAEQLALRTQHLKDLIESVNEGWNNSLPLTGTRPQPDYSVGFRREAFGEDQLAKLSPFIGDIFTDQSYSLGTYYMYFPFLACPSHSGGASATKWHQTCPQPGTTSSLPTLPAINCTMTTAYPEYSIDAEIASFFAKASATRSACDARARELARGSVVPVEFRLKSLDLRTETATLARKVYGDLAPKVSREGQVGDEIDGKEPLYIYLMSRIWGITYLDFILAHGFPENSHENFAWRKNLIADVACFFALSWKAPQLVDSAYRDHLGQTYVKELRLLLSALPDRFHHIIQNCIESMDAILSLPMVLLHRDFATCNIIVEETSCHLVGVIDWAEAGICPFGLNLHSLQALTGKLHLKDGWMRYEDYAVLQHVFWDTFKREVGGLTEDSIWAIRLARITGLLLSSGFTSRLANKPSPVPISNDERGRYNMLSLDGFLINPATRFEDLD
ncbi:Uncharacterized protein TPAR_00173 [Tolypocladium paradoxum]|uniref:Uncharacterized protein n=1 Tax=Tolypocladium paradoxum TaxID=94208 RepID=A0A2S4LB42_9HYPO|nr:Uncharacterized protein TPAR_00173 [Tolypocladium paradoxum]